MLDRAGGAVRGVSPSAGVGALGRRSPHTSTLRALPWASAHPWQGNRRRHVMTSRVTPFAVPEHDERLLVILVMHLSRQRATIRTRLAENGALFQRIPRNTTSPLLPSFVGTLIVRPRLFPESRCRHPRSGACKFSFVLLPVPLSRAFVVGHSMRPVFPAASFSLTRYTAVVAIASLP